MEGIVNALHGESIEAILEREKRVLRAIEELKKAVLNARPHGRNYDEAELAHAQMRTDHWLKTLREMDREYLGHAKATLKCLHGE